jgi:hypothetical protein
MNEVSLASRSERAEADNDILVVDDYGHPENRPRLHWLSPERLQITIPNISSVGLQKSSYQGVDIVIKHEPDDPSAREKWLRERGQLTK